MPKATCAFRKKWNFFNEVGAITHNAPLQLRHGTMLNVILLDEICLHRIQLDLIGFNRIRVVLSIS